MKTTLKNIMNWTLFVCGSVALVLLAMYAGAIGALYIHSLIIK